MDSCQSGKSSNAADPIMLSRLKSVHFKKTVARSSFLSKMWYFSTVFVLMSADVVLKSTTVLKEMRIAQLSPYNERTLSIASMYSRIIIIYCLLSAPFLLKLYEPSLMSLMRTTSTTASGHAKAAVRPSRRPSGLGFISGPFKMNGDRVAMP